MAGLVRVRGAVLSVRVRVRVSVRVRVRVRVRVSVRVRARGTLGAAGLGDTLGAGTGGAL